MMKRIIYVVTLVAFLIGLIIQVVEFRAYDRSFYEKAYAKLDTYEYIGISEEDLKETTDVLLSYMEGKRDDMVVYATINGIEREVFNDREKTHMIDVIDLINTALCVKYASFLAFIIAIFYAYKKKGLKEFGKSGIYAVIVLAILLACIGGFILYDFDLFWTCFHLVFFDNDLWLLNPYTDVMIQMFPLEFFYDMVSQIVLLSIMSITIFLVSCIYFCKREMVRD